MLIILSLLFFWFLILFFFREWYNGELIISFLPYIWWFLLLIVIYLLFIVWKNIYSKSQKKSLKIKISPLFLILFWILFWLYANELNNFYNQDYLEKWELDAPIKILFSNIYKENFNYDAIKQTISNEDPDVVMFVEFSDEHEENLKDYINEKYPYFDKTNRSRIFGWSVVMSKYPITNFHSIFKQTSAWKYWYFMVEKGTIPYYFYLIHTSSPTSYFDFKKRNQQLNIIKKEFFLEHENSRDEDAKIIMIWDFNLSPWSHYYKTFVNDFQWKFRNITRSVPMLFTRNLSEMLKIHKDFTFLPTRFRKYIWYFPILWSHIDQAFVTNSLKVKNFKKIHIDWSDHDWFVFEIE